MKYRFTLIITITYGLVCCDKLDPVNPNDPNFILDPPSELMTEIASGTEITIIWRDNSDNKAGFRLERDSGDGFQQLVDIKANITSFTDSGLNFATDYTYRVASYSDKNVSDWVKGRTVNIKLDTAPDILSAVKVSNSSIELTWVDNCNFEVGYIVERDSGYGFTSLIELDPNVTSILDVGIAAGGSYRYRLAAFTSTFESEFAYSALVLFPLEDVDGNRYETIQIGSQTWMAENLKVTHYRDGTSIPTGHTDSEWVDLSTGAFTVYENSGTNAETYGALYNWYAVNGVGGGASSSDKELAPDGWHIPTDEDWTTLTNYLGNQYSAGGILKESGTTHWTFPNTDANNESGFTALPGGMRHPNGDYFNIGDKCYFWVAGEFDATVSWYRMLTHDYAVIFRTTADKRYGYSVRCVRD